MKKTLMLVGALAFAGTLAACNDEAKAQEAAALSGVGVTLNNDIYYNIDTEAATAEPEIVVSAFGAEAYASPAIDIEEFEIGNINTGLAYNLELTDNIGLVPYAEANFNNDLEHIDTVIGVKTSIKLF